MLNYTPLEAEPQTGERERSRDGRELAGLLKALSDPTRLRIFDLLMEGTHCNCEISARLGLSLSLISHHLRMLRQAGLIEGERDPQDERWIYYSVNRAALERLAGALGRLLDAGRMRHRTPACEP